VRTEVLNYNFCNLVFSSVYISNTWNYLPLLFTRQQMHYLLSLEMFKIYTRIHTNIAPTCFGLRPSSGSLYWARLKLC
jgi:hypothetical protein